MRFVLAILAVWFAICLVPSPPPAPPPSMEEKVWLSRTCENSKWYLEDSDDQTATLACYEQPPSSGDGDGN